MPICFVCGVSRSPKKLVKVLDRKVCTLCRPFLGGSGYTPEREIAALDQFDRQGKSSPWNIR